MKDGLRLVLLDRLGHHIENVVHNGSTKLQIEVGLDTLLRDRLRNTLAITTFKLAREQVTKPKDQMVSSAR